MKTNLLLFLLLVTTTPFINRSVKKETPKIEVDFPVIGPFMEGANDYNLTGVVTSHINMEVNEILYVRHRDGSLWKASMKSFHKIEENDTYNLTFNLPLKYGLYNDGLSFQLCFIDRDKTVISEYNFNLSPIHPNTINPKDYLNQYYEIKDIVIDPDDYLNVNTEKFMFSEFPDYIDADYYHRLDIKNLKMSYYAPNIMKNAKGYLRFYDYYKIFPYLDNNEIVPYFDIPVIAKEKNNEIKMSFSGNFFVNIQTLDMSFVKRDGFVKTNYFYLPLNKSNQLLDQMFTLHFDSFGYGQTSFSWDMRYITNRHLVGNCDDSEYCVKGEIVNA